MGNKVQVAWKKLVDLRDDPKIGHIVRQIDAAHDLHHVKLAMAVRRTQPGVAYQPVRVQTAPTLARIFADVGALLRSYERSQFWIEEGRRRMRKYPALLGL